MANLITLSRFPLMFFYLAGLYYGPPRLHYWLVGFIIIIFLMDAADGWVARTRDESSLLGSVLDIATDRSLEYVLWVVFAHLGLISVLVPLIVLIRGTAVDAMRSVGARDGKQAFEQVQNPISKFLVSSRLMRGAYGVVKGAAAAVLTLSLAMNGSAHPWQNPVALLAGGLAWLSVAICLARGIPVLAEGAGQLQERIIITSDE